MKETIRSVIRHALTGVGSFVSYLLKQGWITAEEAAQLAPALDKLLDVLAVVLGAVVSRLVILGLGKISFGKALAEKFGVLMIGGLAAAGVAITLPSCSVLEGVDVDGKIYYRHESGAKGGITFVPGRKPGVWIRVPVRTEGDEDDTGVVWDVEVNPAK